MTTKVIIGECDCCGKNRKLSLVYYQGIETYACFECRNAEPDEDQNGEMDSN